MWQNSKDSAWGFIPAASFLHQNNICELPARVYLEEWWLSCTSTASQLYRVYEDVFTVQMQTCRINVPFLFKCLSWHKVGLDSGASGGKSHSQFKSSETQDWPLEKLMVVKTVVYIIHWKKIKRGGSYVKVSWADFTPKHEGFNTQAWHKAHLRDLKDSKQSQRIWKQTINLHS